MKTLEVELRYHTSISFKDPSTGKLDKDDLSIASKVTLGVPEVTDSKEVREKEMIKALDVTEDFFEYAYKASLRAKRQTIIRKMEAQQRIKDEDNGRKRRE